MDPAAGNVSLSWQNLFIDASSILGYDSRSPNTAVALAENFASSQWDQLDYDENFDAYARKTRSGQSIQWTNINVRNSNGPAASWMCLLTSGLTPNQDIEATPTRCTVDSNLSCAPTSLQCKWPAFVYLVLGVGVNLENGDNITSLSKLKSALAERSRLGLPISLRDYEGRKLVDLLPTSLGNVARLVPGHYTFSVRRMLAYENIMLLDDGRCIALPSLETFHLLDILAFSMTGLVRWRKQQNEGPRKLSTQPREQYGMDISTTTRTWRQDSFEHTLVWTIYAEMVFLETGEIVPTCQTFLNWQEMSLVWLGRLDAARREAFLSEILGNGDLKSQVLRYLESCWEAAIFSTGAIPFENSPLQGLVDLPVLVEADRLRERLGAMERGWTIRGRPCSTHRPGTSFDHSLARTKPNIWQRAKTQAVYRNILARYNPNLTKRTSTELVVEPDSLAEFAAHLLIATSITRAWPRTEWYCHWEDVEDDGRVHYWVLDEHPVATLLLSHSGDPSTMDDLYFI
ncbi:hypothetical protein B0J15DRAFT_468173 [Fusarium solani]|uniref:Uncharacterized protein n=1 Tax=Fusarium solani TaxID=169388 RepID=A0A9P9H0A3_FUSSL|nr:uncharacterized protein B0J15DRAFT_468173 [Fusarium solani]KAH7248132.1 hypothetical protein B0J15DRAFT_468173 [Fusarium solani]